MNLLYHTVIHKQRRNAFLLVCIFALIFITIASDLLFAHWQNTSFFLPESLLFSTFWLLLFPILNLMLSVTPASDFRWTFLFAAAAGATIHFFAYPGLVWLLSRFFYYHTFHYWQTFNFGLTEHLIKAVIIYTLAYPVSFIYKNRLGIPNSNVESQFVSPAWLTSLVVSDANNKKVLIAVNDVLYFSANPPYVNIHHPTKRYLHPGTLKALEVQLNAEQFIRIHKSFLVNIRSAVSYQSRLNGDYDLSLSDGTLLRVSRNYAATFKKCFREYHQVNAK